MSKANIVPYSNLSQILKSISSNLCIISIYHNSLCDLYKKDNALNSFIFDQGNNNFSMIFNFIRLQVNISYLLIKKSNNIDLWVFYLGDLYLFPLIVNKLFKKNSLLLIGGSLDVELSKKKKSFSMLAKLAKEISLRLVNGIVLYSPRLIKEWNLETYGKKIIIAHEHIVDFSKFREMKPINDRPITVGFIGRLSEEKGILNFIEAIRLLVKEGKNLRFFIGGDGHLQSFMKEYILRYHLGETTTYAGWISHEKLPEYLNDIKLLVLPSYSEGLPNILLEAMACGTPILATPVGAIPDIINDCETGFIMENNSPECITANIIRALERQDLESIAKRARTLVKHEFTYEMGVEIWRKVLEEVGDECR